MRRNPRRIALLGTLALLAGCDARDEGVVANNGDDAIPPAVTSPPRSLPTLRDDGGPRMLAIVGGTLRYERGCFFVGGEGEGTKRLVVWPERVRAGEDASGPYVDTGVTRLRPGEVFRSGGGEVPSKGRELPEECRTPSVVIAYNPYRPDPGDAPAPPDEPPPPPSPQTTPSREPVPAPPPPGA